MMNTYTFMYYLSLQQSKHDYLQTLEIELDSTTEQLRKLGYNIDRKIGLVGKQSLDTAMASNLYQFFRNVHFMYWGLREEWPKADPIDALYFIGLRGFAESQYNSLK